MLQLAQYKRHASRSNPLVKYSNKAIIFRAAAALTLSAQIRKIFIGPSSSTRNAFYLGMCAHHTHSTLDTDIS